MNPRIRQTGPKQYQIMSTPKPKKPTRQTKAELLEANRALVCSNLDLMTEFHNVKADCTELRKEFAGLKNDYEDLGARHLTTLNELTTLKSLSWWDKLWGAK